jgi:hypothetical protein
MGDVDINWFAVILAALSSVGVSWLWYSKYLFRDRWRRFAGLTLDREEKGLIPALVVAGVAGLFMAYVVAYVGSLIEANSQDGAGRGLLALGRSRRDHRLHLRLR